MPTHPATRPSAKKVKQANPRYLWLRDCLLKDIQTGKYPVGGSFPTEEQIATAYKVSRHTVREATRQLSEDGLISRRRSTGTIVTARQPTLKNYVAALGSMKELMEYTMTTQLSVFAQQRVLANATLAGALGCEPKSEWLMLKTHRKVINDPEPISYTEVYLRPKYANIAKHLRGRHPSILQLHQDLFDEPVHSVVQRIEAARMPRAAAELLGLSPATPTLKMTRIYENAEAQVMSASLNFYISERFDLVTRWTRSEEPKTWSKNET